MTANFDRLFKAKPLREKKVPDFMLDYLNESLAPNDLKYIRGSEGTCILTSRNGKEDVISDLKIELTDKQKEILGPSPTIEDIFNFSYNSQQEIKTKEKSKFILNGHEIRSNQYMINPFSIDKNSKGVFSFKPLPFPDYKDIILECSGYQYSFKLKRVPNLSIDDEKYISDENKILTLIFIYNRKKGLTKLTANFNNNVSGSFNEMVTFAYIYNGIIQGKTCLAGKTVPLTEKSDAPLISNETISVWKKIVELQIKFDKEFISTPLLDNLDVITVVKLYYSLIKKEPLKTFDKINSINLSKIDLDNYNSAYGKEIFLQFDNVIEINVFGEKLSLYMLSCVYHIKMGILNESDEFKIDFDEVDGKKSFISSMFFLNEDQLKEYKKTHSVNNEFYRAKYLKDCIKDFGH